MLEVTLTRSPYSVITRSMRTNWVKWPPSVFREVERQWNDHSSLAWINCPYTPSRTVFNTVEREENEKARYLLHRNKSAPMMGTKNYAHKKNPLNSRVLKLSRAAEPDRLESNQIDRVSVYINGDPHKELVVLTRDDRLHRKKLFFPLSQLYGDHTWVLSDIELGSDRSEFHSGRVTVFNRMKHPSIIHENFSSYLGEFSRKLARVDETLRVRNSAFDE